MKKTVSAPGPSPQHWLYIHFQNVLITFFQSFKKANLMNIKKAKSLLQTISNFSMNRIQQHKTEKKQKLMTDAERNFFNNYMKTFDDIVAVNTFIYLLKEKYIQLKVNMQQ